MCLWFVFAIEIVCVLFVCGGHVGLFCGVCFMYMVYMYHMCGACHVCSMCTVGSVCVHVCSMYMTMIGVCVFLCGIDGVFGECVLSVVYVLCVCSVYGMHVCLIYALFVWCICGVLVEYV